MRPTELPTPANNRLRHGSPSTTFALPVPTRLVRDLGLRARLAPALSPHPKVRSSPVRDALPRSLQPTRCHEYPPVFRLPGMVLAHFCSRLPSPPQTRTRLRAPEHGEIRFDAKVSVAGHPDPRWCCGGRRIHQLRVRPALPEGATHRSGRRPARACSATRKPDERLAGAPCHAAPRTRSKSVPPARHQEPLLSRCANTGRLEARSTFPR